MSKKLTIYIDGKQYTGQNVTIALTESDTEENLITVQDMSPLSLMKPSEAARRVWIETHGDLSLYSLQMNEKGHLKAKIEK